MKELSVFIDESGDFGEYDDQAPYYIITMVFHDQSQAITDAVQKLDQELSYMDLNDLCIHTGPIVRREETYEFMPITERRRIFNKLVAFFRQVDIRYKCISIEKKHADGPSSQNLLFPFLKGGIHWRSGIRPRRHDSSGR